MELKVVVWLYGEVWLGMSEDTCVAAGSLAGFLPSHPVEICQGVYDGDLGIALSSRSNLCLG